MAVPVPENTLYLRWNFVLTSGGAPVETASVGLHATRVHRTGNPVDWEDDLQGWCDAHADIWAVNYGGMKGITSAAVRLDNVELYLIDAASGKANGKGMAQTTGDAAWAGTVTQGLPFQCSLVVSTYGYTPGGFTTDATAKRGRYYLPPFSDDALDGDGRMSSTQQNNVKVWTNAYLNAVQGSEIGGTGGGQTQSDYLDIRVLSLRKQKADRTVGIMTPITDFRVGRVIDTQRRRRRSLDEAYVNGTVDHS